VRHKLEFSTDHRPVIRTLAVKLKLASPRTTPTKRYDIRLLQIPDAQSHFAAAIKNRFDAPSTNEKADWNLFKDAMHEAASSTLGTVTHCKKEWISPETFRLVEQKRSLRMKGDVTSYRATDKLCKRQICKDRQKWADDLAEQAEVELAEGRMKDAFSNFQLL